MPRKHRPSAKRGSVYQRAPRTWQVAAWGPDPRALGKRIRHRRTVEGNRTDAQKALTKLLRDIDTMTAGDPSRVVFAKFLTEQFMPYLVEEKKVRSPVIKRYWTLHRVHISPAIGAIPLDRLQPAHVRAIVSKMLRAGLAPSTVRAVKGRAHHALAWALKAGYVAVNVADAVDLPKSSEPDLHVPTPAELSAVIGAAQGTPWEIPLLLSCSTGARRSEVLGVRWSDFTAETGKLEIRRGLQRVPTDDGGTRLDFLPVKSDRSRRDIYLLAAVVERLRAHRKEQADRQEKIGLRVARPRPVCERGDGSPCDPWAFSRAFKTIAAGAGLHPATRLHDLRHGFATALMELDVQTAVTSALLGHSSVAFTQQVYTAIRDKMKIQAAEALGKVLNLPVPGDSASDSASQPIPEDIPASMAAASEA